MGAGGKRRRKRQPRLAVILVPCASGTSLPDDTVESVSFA